MPSSTMGFSSPLLDGREIRELFDRCCNWGRWGDDDELGTLNYITPQKRRAAAGLVRTGESVSLARPLSVEENAENLWPVTHHSASLRTAHNFAICDYIGIFCHGFAVTHIDALCHCTYEGKLYNGRDAAELSGHRGVPWADLVALQNGIFTRAVLLDVAAARGVEYLDTDEYVTVADLEKAEELAGVRVDSGDALIVRSGLKALEADRGILPPQPRAGLAAECVAWIHDRQVAVFGGDCVELMPHPGPIPMPLHNIGVPAMGLIMLDWPDVEPFAAAARHGSSEALLTVNPLVLPGGTGCAVNPVCVF